MRRRVTVQYDEVLVRVPAIDWVNTGSFNGDATPAVVVLFAELGGLTSRDSLRGPYGCIE